MAQPNSQNLRIGEVEVYFDKLTGQGEQLLGHTKGGAELSFEREFEDLTVDKYGSTPVDMALTGHNLTVKVYLAEPTNLYLDYAIPEGEYAIGPLQDNKIAVGRDSGYLLSTKAGQLRLHPRNLPNSNRNEDIYIWKAVSVETVEMNYKIDEQRILEVTFRALVDESQPNGQRLGRFGDNTIS